MHTRNLGNTCTGTKQAYNTTCIQSRHRSVERPDHQLAMFYEKAWDSSSEYDVGRPMNLTIQFPYNEGNGKAVRCSSGYDLN
jgi:hypothetical protein